MGEEWKEGTYGTTTELKIISIQISYYCAQRNIKQAPCHNGTVCTQTKEERLQTWRVATHTVKPQYSTHLLQPPLHCAQESPGTEIPYNFTESPCKVPSLLVVVHQKSVKSTLLTERKRGLLPALCAKQSKLKRSLESSGGCSAVQSL